VTDDVFGGHDDDVVVSLGRDELDSALKCASAPSISGAPPGPGDHPIPANLALPGLPKTRAIASCSEERMLTPTTPTSRARGHEWLADTAENEIRDGSSESAPKV